MEGAGGIAQITAIAPGDAVAAGEVLATVGDSGGRAEPQLYFELRRSGRPLDPTPWFRGRSPD